MPRTSSSSDAKADLTLSPKRTKGRDGHAVLSPNCVAAVADLALEPPIMELGSKSQRHGEEKEVLKHKHHKDINDENDKKRNSNEDIREDDCYNDDDAIEPVRHHARHGTDVENLPHLCWWAQLHDLKGQELVDRLKAIQLDDMIDYHGGVLNARFVEKIVRLYDHVNEQGDTPEGIYSAADGCVELPFWCPAADDSGFTRLERLEMAAEYDVWQWYLVTGDNYSLLDALIWMGVQMKKLWSRPMSPAK